MLVLFYPSVNDYDYSCCFKISGVAKYYQSGEYFDFVKKLEMNKKQNPKAAIAVRIDDVIEFK